MISVNLASAKKRTKKDRPQRLSFVQTDGIFAAENKTRSADALRIYGLFCFKRIAVVNGAAHLFLALVIQYAVTC